MEYQHAALPQLTALLPMPEYGMALPEPANENRKLKSDWMTPGEALQAIRNIKKILRRENANEHTLIYSSQRRKLWIEVLACEQCLLGIILGNVASLLILLQKLLPALHPQNLRP